MKWLTDINQEFRDILKNGIKQGKAKLTNEQVEHAELYFLPYTNIIQKQRILVSPPVDVIVNISDDLYKQIKKIYPKYNQNIIEHFGTVPIA